jgi:hypothetical protein
VSAVTGGLAVQRRGTPSPLREPPRPWLRRHWLVLALLGALLGLFRAEANLGDSDVLWSARAGLDMLHTGHVPHHDYYSWTVPGKNWTPNSWGWNLVLGITYRLGGLTGIFILGIALTVLLCLAIGWFAKRIGADPARTAMVMALIGMLMRFPLYARPQFIDYVMVFVLPALAQTVMSEPARAAWKSAAALCVVQIVWMNLHSSAVLGPAIVAVAGAGLLVGRTPLGRRETTIRLLGIILATSACCLATPYGTAPIRHIQEVRDASVGYIKEWAHAGIHGAGPIFGLVAIAIALVACIAAVRGRRYDSAAVLVLLAATTASAIRFTPMAVLFAAPEFAVLFGRLRIRHFMADRIAAMGCITVGVLVLSGVSHFAEPGGDVWSPRLVAELPHGCRTLNDYGIGGELLLKRPDVRVSWDGRNDLYGRSVELMVVRYLDAKPGTLAALDAARVNCVLTTSTDRIVSVLERTGRWRVAGTEGARTLLLRSAADRQLNQ